MNSFKKFCIEGFVQNEAFGVIFSINYSLFSINY